jgi:hypothetical protein
MVCVCHKTISALRLALPRLNVAASASLSAHADLHGLFAWLAALGLPAAPWQPDEAWLDIQLPTMSLDASAMATISAFAQLRAEVLAQFGIDLLIPGQANALIRLVATLNARLDAVLAAEASLALGLNAQAWLELSATMTAVLQVQAALALNLLPHPPPPGPPLALWRPFLIRLRALLPLIAASVQLGINLSEDISAQLAMMIRAMVRIQLPAPTMASMSLMSSLTSSLSAVAQLRLALGIDPLEIGLPAVQRLVAERVQLVESMVQSTTGFSLSALLAMLLRLPRPAFCATLMAPAPVVRLAASINARALESITWQVPAVASLPVLSIGLPAVAFTAQMNAALGMAVALRPCVTCDAGPLLNASLASHAGAGASGGARH